jgi:hypothetical protein
MSLHELFNQSGFSRFLNTAAGRVFRLVAGAAFLLFGFAYRGSVLGVVSMAWSVFPLTAGAFDVCYISAVLGGPFSGRAIRREQQVGKRTS